MRDVALELAEYRALHDTYPPTLDELKSQAIAAIPKDLLTEAPLSFEKTVQGYILRAPFALDRTQEPNTGVRIEMPIPPLPEREF